MDALDVQGVRAGHVSGRHGVWVDGERKIASIGVAVERWVTFHGFALNVDLDLGPFERFHPCGLSGSLMTSVARELGRPVALDSVKPSVVAAWSARFAAAAPRSRTPAAIPPRATVTTTA